MEPLPKPIKRQLNTLVGQAYENELSQELEVLAAQVDEWRAGRIAASELARLIHEADTGPLRDLYKGYDTPYRELLIASGKVSCPDQSRTPPQRGKRSLHALISSASIFACTAWLHATYSARSLGARP